MSSNIPINQAYSTYYSQIIRYFKANNNYSNFVNNVKCLYNKLCKQNFNKRLLLKYLKLNVGGELLLGGAYSDSVLDQILIFPICTPQ